MVRSVTSEDDDGSSQHLEGTGVGEGETDVLETGGRHVTQSGGQKYLTTRNKLQWQDGGIPSLPRD